MFKFILMRRTQLFALLLTCIASVIVLTRVSVSAETDWQAKVDPLVLSQARSGSTDFLVILAEQAELAPTVGMDKLAKATYVFNTLSSHATATQGSALRALEEQGADAKGYWIANYIAANGSLEAVEAVARLDSVSRVAANARVEAQFPAIADADRAPNGLDVTWGISRTKTIDVWQTYNITGTGVVIGGQDTGYKWDHVSLIDSYRGWDGTIADHNYNWHDSIHENDPGNSGSNVCGLNATAPCDDFGHGTHTMGTMSGGAQSGTSIGLAPGSDWIGCRNMERGDGRPSTYLECFEWFLAPTDIANENADPAMAPHVINNSWHCPVSEDCTADTYVLFQAAINNLRASGVVVVVSASNSGPGCSSVQTPPPMFDGTFAVGSIQSNGAISGFSSRGPVTIDGSNRMKPDIVAPGSGVFSSTLGGHGNSSGTSMAGPHIAGVVALIISAEPSLAGDVDAIEQIIRDTAVPRTTTQLCGADTITSVPNNVFGHGEVDALAAVEAALNLSPSSAELTTNAVDSSPTLTPAIFLVILVTLGSATLIATSKRHAPIH